jgi:hypothetical protein
MTGLKKLDRAECLKDRPSFLFVLRQRIVVSLGKEILIW